MYEMSFRDRAFRLLIYAVGMALVLPLGRAALVILPVLLISLWPQTHRSPYYERLLVILNIVLAPLHILLMRDSNYDWPSIYVPMAGSYLAMLLFLLLASGIFANRVRPGKAVLAYVSIFFAFTVSSEVRDSDIGQGAIMFLAVAIWYFIYVAMFARPKGDQKIGSFEMAALCAPGFWLPISTPVPGMLPNWLEKAKSLEFDEIQKSGLRLLIFIVIPTYIFIETFKSIAPIHPLLYSISRSYIQFQPIPLGIVEGHLTWVELWTSAIFGVVYVTANFALQFGIGVTIARMCGLPLLRGVYKVHQSMSFHEFFYRFNYYYAQFALDIFIVPLMKRLKRWKVPPTYVQPIGFALGVMLATTLFHIFRWPHLLSEVPLDFISRETQIGFYYVAIGALVGLSIWIGVKLKTPAWKRIELIVFFCLFSALALAYRNYTVSDREQAYLMLRRLFLLE